jgi:cephalosporin-C deacetylase
MALPLFDLPLDELRAHRTASTPPDDLDGFWTEAIADARARAFQPTLEPYRRDVYRDLDVVDVTFAGADGDPVRACTCDRPVRARNRSRAE